MEVLERKTYKIRTAKVETCWLQIKLTHLMWHVCLKHHIHFSLRLPAWKLARKGFRAVTEKELESQALLKRTKFTLVNLHPLQQSRGAAAAYLLSFLYRRDGRRNQMASMLRQRSQRNVNQGFRGRTWVVVSIATPGDYFTAQTIMKKKANLPPPPPSPPCPPGAMRVASVSQPQLLLVGNWRMVRPDTLMFVVGGILSL